MASDTLARPVVLIVDDEEAVADTYALRLREQYETRVAYGGEEALEMVDETVDAVVLDRRMPDVHGDEVLAEIRDRGYDCKVIMATAVDPDLNILEMEFDDYLCKPIFQETLVGTLEQHLGRPRRDARLDEFFRIVSKLSVIETEKARAELEESAEYARLKERAEVLRGELRESIAEFDDIVSAYRDLNRQS